MTLSSCLSLCAFPLPIAPSTPMATRPSTRGNHGDPAFHVCDAFISTHKLIKAVPVCLIQTHLSFSHAAACIQSQLSIEPVHQKWRERQSTVKHCEYSMRFWDNHAHTYNYNYFVWAFKMICYNQNALCQNSCDKNSPIIVSRPSQMCYLFQLSGGVMYLLSF